MESLIPHKEVTSLSLSAEHETEEIQKQNVNRKIIKYLEKEEEKIEKKYQELNVVKQVLMWVKKQHFKSVFRESFCTKRRKSSFIVKGGWTLKKKIRNFKS